ncbi:MAG TPA: type II secretion system protein GspE [Elusimicrobia bacterium]|nr:type II secretion system protein GspE [Elusimicrobiota bacterium]
MTAGPAQDIEAALRAQKFSEVSLLKARQASQENGHSLSQNLIALNLLTLEELCRMLSEYYKVPFIPLQDETHKRFFGLVPLPLIIRHRVVPLGLENRALTLGMVNPRDVEASDTVTFMTGYEVVIVGVLEHQYEPYVEEMSRTPTQLVSMEDLIRGVAEKARESSPLSNLVLNEVSDSAIQRFIRTLVDDALTQHASDIHIEPQETSLLLRYRTDGMLRTVHRMPLTVLPQIISVFKIMANLDITDTRHPQDGRITLKLDTRNVDLRIATIATHYGENLVMRILDARAAKVGMSDLGMPDYIHARLKDLGLQNTGILLVTGPTGSGKTTTLYSFIQMIRTPSAKIITLEDPIEFPILEGDRLQEGGITQIQINPKINMTFGIGLRAALRLDPDILFVGEIRDLETAEIAFSAALTGRLVLSTLHTNDAPSTIARLIDMEVDSFLIAGALKAVMSQRLVRRLCPQCRIKYDPPAKTLDRLAASLPREVVMSIVPTLYRPRGCPGCGGSGYSGRIGLYELLEINDDLRLLIQNRASITEIVRAAQATEMRTLRMTGLIEVLKGRTTLAEVFRVTPSDT